MPISHVENIDCNIAMRAFPDKFFDLAIVDPPYGIGAGVGFGRSQRTSNKIIKKDWDNSVPDDSYFNELFRVSKNQIIWGGNYFNLKPTRCYIIWDKVNSGRDFADCELAWTSFDQVARIFKYRVASESKFRFHPTQKPVLLYDYLLRNYAKSGFKILDTHLGSGSSRIAALNLGFDFWGYEVDPEMFVRQDERFKQGNECTFFQGLIKPTNLFDL